MAFYPHFVPKRNVKRKLFPLRIFTSNNVTNAGEKWENFLSFSDEGGEAEDQAGEHTEKR